MTLLNIGLRRMNPCPNRDQASSPGRGGELREGFGAIGKGDVGGVKGGWALGAGRFSGFRRQFHLPSPTQRLRLHPRARPARCRVSSMAQFSGRTSAQSEAPLPP